MNDDEKLKKLEEDLLRVRLAREKIQLENEQLRQKAYAKSRNLFSLISYFPVKVFNALLVLFLFIKKRIFFFSFLIALVISFNSLISLAETKFENNYDKLKSKYVSRHCGEFDAYIDNCNKPYSFMCISDYADCSTERRDIFDKNNEVKTGFGALIWLIKR